MLYLITIRSFSGKILHQDVEGHPDRERAQLSAIETADMRVLNWAEIAVKVHVDGSGFRRVNA